MPAHRQTRNVLSLALCSCLFFACSSDTDLASVNQGMYQIDAWTVNEQGCQSEGPSKLDATNDTYVVIAHATLTDEDFVVMEPCADATNCATTLDDVNAGGVTFVELTRGNNADGFSAQHEWVTFDNSQCINWLQDAQLTVDENGVATFERRTRFKYKTATGLLGCALDEDNDVFDEPCAELEIMTATRLAPLP